MASKVILSNAPSSKQRFSALANARQSLMNPFFLQKKMTGVNMWGVTDMYEPVLAKRLPKPSSPVSLPQVGATADDQKQRRQQQK